MSNVELNDWARVGFSALWILGLSVALSALGFADCRASVEAARTRQVLGRPGYQVAVNLGLVLFCLGLSGSGRAVWERTVLGLLALAFAIQAWLASGAPSGCWLQTSTCGSCSSE